MSKQLYEEALADVKKVKEVAEDNAKRAILEAVTPRIRDLIEQELMRSVDDVDDVEDDEDAAVESDVIPAPGSEPLPGDEMLTDDTQPPAIPQAPEPIMSNMASAQDDLETTDDIKIEITPGTDVELAAVSAPGADGKVTLDLDVLAVNDQEDEFELDMNAAQMLDPIVSTSEAVQMKKLNKKIIDLAEQTKLFVGASKFIKQSKAFGTNVANVMTLLENTYDHVQEAVTDANKKKAFEDVLEKCFKNLTTLREQNEMSNNKKSINEMDLTLKLTGLPEEVADTLEDVGVDLELPTEDDEVDTTNDQESPEDVLDMGNDEELELDLGDDEVSAEPVEDESMDDDESMDESTSMSDDTIVEIDENMLRREIARMRALRESKEKDTSEKGNGPGDAESFGGGKEDGEPLDKKLDEAEVCSDEELDKKNETGLRRKEDEHGSEAANSHSVAAEALMRRLGFEKRLQERCKQRAQAAKDKLAETKAPKERAALKHTYDTMATRFTESVLRYKKLTSRLAEATKTVDNSKSKQLAETEAVKTLRNKLAETNLINAKLLYTNKLLQIETLTKSQKALVVKRLDEAKTESDVKRVYMSATKLLGTQKKNVSESVEPKVLGSSSRTTRSASTVQTLSESVEADRWAKLAGIK